MILLCSTLSVRLSACGSHANSGNLSCIGLLYRMWQGPTTSYLMCLLKNFFRELQCFYFFRSCSMWQESTSATVPHLESPQVMGNAMQKLSKLQHPLHYGVCFSFQALSLLSSCGASWRQWYSRHGIKMWHSTDCVSIYV